ncbi:MAG: hypothetical protein PHX13_06190 [Thiovulaceae bacterium]|nr:hypothetical protein [Sulfurimonadaceae bacterium]
MQDESFYFQGIILPERAQLTFSFEMDFSTKDILEPMRMKVNIINNQLAVWIDSSLHWNIFDLKNIVNNLVKSHLNMLGYLKGYAYDLEITRVINRRKQIDYVFGIEIPCLEERGKDVNLEIEIPYLREKISGEIGKYINRCLNDLVSAMKHADDTGFYCYRAIESLKHHCSVIQNISKGNKSDQWKKFREISNTSFEDIKKLKIAADPLRHGEPKDMTSDDRAILFLTTWTIVDNYLKNI